MHGSNISPVGADINHSVTFIFVSRQRACWPMYFVMAFKIACNLSAYNLGGPGWAKLKSSSALMRDESSAIASVSRELRRQGRN